MEVKVEVGLSKGLENIMNRLINAIEGVNAPQKTPAVREGKVGAPGVAGERIAYQPIKEPVMLAEDVSDVEMAKPVEEPEGEVDQDIDYPALRKEIKKLGIKLVQAKKQSEVKALTAKYGCAKMDELPDDKLVTYLEDLKEIQNG